MAGPPGWRNSRIGRRRSGAGEVASVGPIAPTRPRSAQQGALILSARWRDPPRRDCQHGGAVAQVLPDGIAVAGLVAEHGGRLAGVTFEHRRWFEAQSGLRGAAGGKFAREGGGDGKALLVSHPVKPAAQRPARMLRQALLHRGSASPRFRRSCSGRRSAAPRRRRGRSGGPRSSWRRLRPAHRAMQPQERPFRQAVLAPVGQVCLRRDVPTAAPRR